MDGADTIAMGWEGDPANAKALAADIRSYGEQCRRAGAEASPRSELPLLENATQAVVDFVTEHRVHDLSSEDITQLKALCEQIYDIGVENETTAQAFAEAASPAAEWQPIDTAPKDGTFLLLFARCKTATALVPVLGSFCDGEWQELAFTPNYPVGIVPSHWMPRPDWPSPPTTERDARGG